MTFTLDPAGVRTSQGPLTATGVNDGVALPFTVVILSDCAGEPGRKVRLAGVEMKMEGRFTVSTTTTLAVAALALVRETVVEYKPAGSDDTSALTVRLAGVNPLAADSCSQGALLNVAENGSPVAGLLVTKNVCATDGPPTVLFRNMVTGLVESVF